MLSLWRALRGRPVSGEDAGDGAAVAAAVFRDALRGEERCGAAPGGARCWAAGAGARAAGAREARLVPPLHMHVRLACIDTHAFGAPLTAGACRVPLSARQARRARAGA